jgi:hypothetical protein
VVAHIDKGEVMRRQVAAVAALVVIVVLGWGTASATAARSLRFEDGRGGEGALEVTATGRITFPGESGLEPQLVCPITMRSTIPRLVAKVRGAEFGRVTSVSFGTRAQCTANWPYREPPFQALETVAGKWLQTYQAFLGTLPNITGFKYAISPIFIKWNWESFGIPIECLYRGTMNWLLAIERGTVTRATATLGETRLALFSGSAICPTEYVFQASLSTSRLTVTLL